MQTLRDHGLAFASADASGNLREGTSLGKVDNLVPVPSVTCSRRCNCSLGAERPIERLASPWSPLMAKILLVDDDVQLRQSLRLALIIRGHEVVEAGDGRTILQLIGFREAGLPNLMILDWLMPGMDGSQTCYAVRASVEPIRSIPIIATSSLDRRAEALAAGASDFVRKPFDIDDFMTRMDAMLS